MPAKINRSDRSIDPFDMLGHIIDATVKLQTTGYPVTLVNIAEQAGYSNRNMVEIHRVMATAIECGHIEYRDNGEYFAR